MRVHIANDVSSVEAIFTDMSEVHVNKQTTNKKKKTKTKKRRKNWLLYCIWSHNPPEWVHSLFEWHVYQNGRKPIHKYIQQSSITSNINHTQEIYINGNKLNFYVN